MDTIPGSQKDSDDSAATPQDETLEEVRTEEVDNDTVRTFKNTALVKTYPLKIFVLSLAYA